VLSAAPHRVRDNFRDLVRDPSLAGGSALTSAGGSALASVAAFRRKADTARKIAGITTATTCCCSIFLSTRRADGWSSRLTAPSPP
jgi:hypothetical protein